MCLHSEISRKLPYAILHRPVLNECFACAREHGVRAAGASAQRALRTLPLRGKGRSLCISPVLTSLDCSAVLSRWVLVFIDSAHVFDEMSFGHDSSIDGLIRGHPTDLVRFQLACNILCVI